MAASGISESILFSAAIILAVAFVGVFAAVIGNAAQDVGASGTVVSQGYQTEIVLLNDPASMSSPLVVYAKNTGTTTLSAADTDLLLDGVPAENATYDVLGSADDDAWTPGAVLQITTTDLTFGAGEHRIRLISQTGMEAGMTFQA